MRSSSFWPTGRYKTTVSSATSARLALRLELGSVAKLRVLEPGEEKLARREVFASLDSGASSGLHGRQPGRLHLGSDEGTVAVGVRLWLVEHDPVRGVAALHGRERARDVDPLGGEALYVVRRHPDGPGCSRCPEVIAGNNHPRAGREHFHQLRLRRRLVPGHG